MGSVAPLIWDSTRLARFNTIEERMTGLSAPATLLQIPMMLIRLAADSIGPITEIYGFDAVCSSASPIPWMKRPVRNSQKLRAPAAGMNTMAPRAIITRPRDIPLLYPVAPRMKEEGIAR